MEDSLIDTAYALAQLATPDMVAGTIAQGGFAHLALDPGLFPGLAGGGGGGGQAGDGPALWDDPAAGIA